MAGRKAKVKSKLPALKESYDERSLYPWLDIRSEYIEGYEDADGTWIWPTMKQLAERHNAPEKPLQNKASLERWGDHRRAHQNQVAIERQKEHARILSGKAVKFDAQAVETAEFAYGLIQKRLEELAELQQYVIKNRQLYIEAIEAGEAVRVSDLKASAFSGSELESLAKAAALFQEAGRKALGIKDGEVAVQQTNITVQQTNIREELMKNDPDRINEMLRVLGNKNFSMPALNSGPEEEIFEGDVVEEESNGTD
jgi:hypothetical protein